MWPQLEAAAARAGVSAAHYVRDATLARLAYSAGQNGEPFFSGGPLPDEVLSSDDRLVPVDVQSESSAVWAQARLARDRARAVRTEARAMQAESSQGRRVRQGTEDERGRGDE
jgi:hypothetical protein